MFCRQHVGTEEILLPLKASYCLALFPASGGETRALLEGQGSRAPAKERLLAVVFLPFVA